MPEQPPDPLHYDMKIPPEPDPAKTRDSEGSSTEQQTDEKRNESQTAKDTSVVRGDDKPKSGRASG